MNEASEGGGASSNPPAPLSLSMPLALPRYDKFGFLAVDANGEDGGGGGGRNEGRRERHSGSRRRKRRRSRTRSRSRSGSESGSRSRRRRKSGSESKSSGGNGSEWEKGFANFGPKPVPPPPVLAAPPPPPPPTAPAPSYSSNITQGAYPNNYGDQFHSGYGNFSVTGPTVQNRAPPVPEMNLQLGGLNNSQWGQLPPPPVVNPIQDDKTKREAIASELRNQKATLVLQKEEYVRKANVLKRELESLKDQRTELRGDARRSPSPETQKFLKENAKLQDKLQSKLKTMNNVIEMLNGIIESKPGYSDKLNINSNKEKKYKSSHRSSSQSQSSEESSSDNEKRSSRRKSRKTSSGDKKFNYAYYDPELHWCRVCNEFPTTAKDYLTHLHTPQHHRAAAVHMEAPWHSNSNVNEGFASFPGAPIKRTPIKGLQFFVPSTAWYCKLCDQWIGDLHCASAHLKSIVHSKNYTNFTELNPHWEMDWMSDRQKNFEKKSKTGDGNQSGAEKGSSQYSPHTISFQPDGFHTKYKKSENNQDEENTIPLKLGLKKEKKKKEKKDKKKKKKRSTSASSSSSDSSSDSKSEDNKNKKKTENQNENTKPEEDASLDDRLINQWMSVQDTTTEQDRKMLEEVKNRVKSKAEERGEQRVDGRVVSREREAREFLTIKSERARMEAMNSSKNDSKEKEKDYRSSHRDKDKESDRRRSEKSHHRDKDRDYESSKYRSSKNYSMDSDFKPYPGKRENHDANESRFDKQVSKRKSGGSFHSNSNDSKKMPFIGKMPLYKNQGGSKSSKPESEPNKQSEQECMEAAKKKRDEINAQLQKSMETFKEQFISTMAKRNEEIEAQMLPEPKLIVPMSLHSHVPIVDVTEMMIPKAPVISALPQTIHRIQPMSMSASTTVNSVTADGKPLSKNDPLHKDFQDALDIIFPSDDKPKPEIPVPKTTEAEQEDVATAAVSEAEADPNLYSQVAVQDVSAGYQNVQMMMPGVMTPMAAPYMSHMMMGYDYTGTMYDPNMYDMSAVQSLAPDSGVPKSTTDMEDLAMLGIDAEDVGAGGF